MNILTRQDLHQAISILEPGLRICQGTLFDNLFLLRLVASRLGYAYALSGRIVEAVTLLEQVIAGTPSRQAEVANREYLAWLGETYLMASRQDEAMALARQALELSRASHERGHQARALRRLCRKFCSGGHEGTTVPVGRGLTRSGSRTIRPQ